VSKKIVFSGISVLFTSFTPYPLIVQLKAFCGAFTIILNVDPVRTTAGENGVGYIIVLFGGNVICLDGGT